MPQGLDQHKGVFVISVAAELSGMHPQTLRTYDRLGIVSPQRTRGRGRRYSAWNIAQLREVQRLSQEEGINLAGIKRIMELERQVEELQGQLERAAEAIMRLQGQKSRVFTGSADGEVTPIRRGERPPERRRGGALVLYRGQRGPRV
ncbi:heat shock protein transcriptional repressor HspR [Helcobacillus massiliensis]|uniref:heat shock protein transcriptional repressor HspR n=1 Tax=Helcobacillus massiliensis TaxID=521392 RepID=UPI0025553B96|nr:helix-turn-helix transcriptional regulator [Helcobacillus massiliensis]MDK7742305.1 helix-turn-helix transcriptional regulator [Helcobacillus massiliensis]WOO92058.1 helix-turn-helix transcriptional regulator [Helcobacillus massiliensis]